jgi:hypothetical protein
MKRRSRGHIRSNSSFRAIKIVRIIVGKWRNGETSNIGALERLERAINYRKNFTFK